MQFQNAKRKIQGNFKFQESKRTGSQVTTHHFGRPRRPWRGGARIAKIPAHAMLPTVMVNINNIKTVLGMFTALGLALMAAGTPRPGAVAAGPPRFGTGAAPRSAPAPTLVFAVTKTEAEWRQQLTPQQYHVLREAGTERAFSGAFWATKEPGVYRCAGCGQVLFTSETKFDFGCGWPSFYELAALNSVVFRRDNRLGMHRTEVVCAHCGGHLGEEFDDGPAPTRKRFCINSTSLILEPDPLVASVAGAGAGPK